VETMAAIRKERPGLGIEVLLSDLSGNWTALRRVLEEDRRCSTTMWRPCPASTRGFDPRPTTRGPWSSSRGQAPTPRPW